MTQLRVSPSWPAVLPPAVSFNLRRIIQEAITNVRKHSGASRVDIALGAAEGRLKLEVSDNGAGILEARHRDTGCGIIGMRERAELLGGSLQILSAPGKGTVVSVTTGEIRPDEGHVLPSACVTQ